MQSKLTTMQIALGLAMWIGITYGAAAIGSLRLPDAWYAALNKPSWNPPNWVFGPVWGALYTLMAVAAWRVWSHGGWGQNREALTLYLLQLVANIAWSWIFFGFKKIGLAFVDVVIMWALIAATTVLFFRSSALAGWLFVPYLAWVSFASVLNFVVWRLNL